LFASVFLFYFISGSKLEFVIRLCVLFSLERLQ